MTISPPDVRSVAEPRVCRYPAYRYSSGDDAIDLAEAAGLTLDPWQQLVLRHGLGERDDGRWAAFEVALLVSRQNGKGAVLEARELAGLFLFGERLILHSAHEYKTAMEAFLRVRALIDGCDDLRRKVRRVNNTNGEEGIELRSGARLRFLARSKGSGRGFSADLVIWDEAYALTADQVEAQMPTLSARPNPQIWYTSSPPLDAVSGEQLFAVRRRALAGHTQSLAFMDYGVDGCLDDLTGVDLDDRTVWAAANPAYPHRISDEAIERERAAMSDTGFARERLGIWPPDLTGGFAVIGEADWAAAYDEASQLAGRPAFAVDVSPDRSRAAIGVAGRRLDGRRHVEVVDAHAGTGWVVPRLVELKARWRPVAVVIDRAGPAGSLIAEVQEAGIEVMQMSASDVARAFGQFYDGVAGPDVAGRVVRHIGQPELTAAVAGATKRPLGEGSAWNRRAATVDLTPLVAVTNALWGFVAAAAGAQAEFNPGVVRL